MRLTRGAAVVLASALAVLAFGPSRAEAYPEFQFATGATRCSECHLAPVGGGLLTDFGRGEAGDTIAGAGDGAFLHGLVELPSWLALGGDVRVGGLARQGRGTEAAVFPMQAELAAHLGFEGLSIDGTFGALAAIRDAGPLAERLGSREHYVMYEPESKGWYLRAGEDSPRPSACAWSITPRTSAGSPASTPSRRATRSAAASTAPTGSYTPRCSPRSRSRRWSASTGWGYALAYERFTGAGTGSWGVIAASAPTTAIRPGWAWPPGVAEQGRALPVR